MRSLLRLLPLFLKYRYRMAIIFLLSPLASALTALSLLMILPVLEVMFGPANRPDEGPNTPAVEVAQPSGGLLGEMIEQPQPEDGGASAAEATTKEGLGKSIGVLKTTTREYIAGRRQQALAYMRQNKVSTLFIIAGFLLTASVLGALLTWGIRQLSASISLDLQKRLRDNLFNRILAQDLDFFRRYPSGQLMSRMSSDVRRVQRMLNTFSGSTIQDFFKVIACFILLVYLSPRLTMYMALTLPIGAVLFLWATQKIRKFARQQEILEAGAFEVMHEAISGIRTVKGFGMETFENRKFRNQTRDILERGMKVQNIKNIVEPATEVLSVASGVVVLLAGGLLFLQRSELLGADFTMYKFVVYLGALSRFYRPLKNFSKLNSVVQVGITGLERIEAVTNEQPTIVSPPGARAMPEGAPRVRFENVWFSYPGQPRSAEPVLQGIELSVEPGEVVALVGRSGAGKTTIINLLCRFYDPCRGRVSVDGIDLRQIDLDSLRSKIGIVPQETFLFNDTVANNIAYGMQGVSREQLVEAARQANAESFITALPRGYDTIIGERGGQLSTGQKQRLAIARAILKNPTVLILDDATSALESETEQQIRNSQKQMSHGRTTFIIAHRFATVMMADRIVVLDRGRIIEQGCHEDLFEAGGLYKTLASYQGLFADSVSEEAHTAR